MMWRCNGTALDAEANHERINNKRPTDRQNTHTHKTVGLARAAEISIIHQQLTSREQLQQKRG